MRIRKAPCEPLFVFLPTNTEAGKNYYVWQEVKMGLLMTLSKLGQVSERKGRKGVMGNKLIQ
ncbi:TPA: hypothetical protein F3L15_14955 [Aeromonas hydrophila]|nr:hypothetical protein RY45_01395 [Aeromonas hydrophila]HAU4885306.1 hypothetical protein [Aeromonas hydrophila]